MNIIYIQINDDQVPYNIAKVAALTEALEEGFKILSATGTGNYVHYVLGSKKPASKKLMEKLNAD